MGWKFSGDMPIYLQIMEQIKAQIAAGTLKPGEKIASVRELAVDAGVNPNTMQKALSELEREGVLYSQRTSGRFVSDNEAKMNLLQEQLAQEQMEQFVGNMKKLGYDIEQTFALFESFCREHSKGGEINGTDRKM